MANSQFGITLQHSRTTPQLHRTSSILAINDLPDQLYLMEVILKQAGYRVLTALSAEQGLSLAQHEQPDMIISDVAMPGMSGIELCRRLRANPEFRLTPILLVSAVRKDSESAVEGIRAGADDYLESPYEPEHLIAKIERLLTRYYASETIKASQNQLQLITDTAPVYIAHCDMERRFKFVNRRYAERFGLSREDIVGRRIEDVLGPAAYQAIKSYVETALSGQTVDFEIEVPYEQLGKRYMQCSYVPELREEGLVNGFVAVITDITERKLSEEALSQSEASLRLVISQIPAFLWATDEDLRVTYSAGAGHTMIGTTPSQYIGMTVYEINQTNDETHPNVAAHLRALRGETSKFERKWMGRTLESYIKPLRGVDDKIIGVIGLSIDITERKLMEQKLRESERLNAEAQQLAHIGSWNHDLRTNIITWSDENYRIFGYKPQEFIPTYASFLEHVDPDDRGWVDAKGEQTLSTKEPFSYYMRVIRVDGEMRIIHSRGQVVCDDSGNPVRIVGTAQDVTERMLVEKQLKASNEKLRALSSRLQSVREEESIRIARELHDKLGGALTGLKIDLSLVNKRLPESVDESVRRKIAAMTEMIDETILTVRHISSELRPSMLDDLGLAAAIEWQAREFEARTEIVCHINSLAEDTSLGEERTTAVFRIFQEILTNVARHSKATRVEMGMQERDGDIILEVQDNGVGISESAVEDRRSLGLLGMGERALVFGGQIKIEGAPGKGTRVTVRIPIE